MNTLSGAGLVASSCGAALAGLAHTVTPVIGAFVAINALAAVAARWA